MVKGGGRKMQGLRLLISASPTTKKEMSLLHCQCKRPKENRSSYYTLKGDQNAKH